MFSVRLGGVVVALWAVAHIPSSFDFKPPTKACNVLAHGLAALRFLASQAARIAALHVIKACGAFHAALCTMTYGVVRWEV